MPAVRHLTGQARTDTIARIAQLAAAGARDPAIGAQVGLTHHQVAALRRENAITAGVNQQHQQMHDETMIVLNRFAREFDWATVPADLWSAFTLKGPWDFPIVAPHAREPIAVRSYPVPDAPDRLPAPKLCENRGWKTYVRGPVMIHAGKGWDRAGESDPRVHAMWRAICPELVLRRDAWTWAGHVTGVARLVDCHRSTPGCCPPWGAYGIGTDVVFHLILDDVRALTEPVPAPGRQQLWRPDAYLVDQVRALIPNVGGDRP